DGVQDTDGSGWRLYRIPLRSAQDTIGAPNIRLIKHLRIAVVADADNGGPDKRAFFALARMRFLGSPWVRRADAPVASLAGASGKAVGEVVSSTVSTENFELGYTSPPGVISGLDNKGGSQGEFGSQVNERSLRVIGREMALGDRAEAYFRFPSGPQNLLRYRQLRAWVRGRGPGWDDGDFRAFIRVGSDSRNFYQYSASALTTTWEPEMRVDLSVWRTLRAEIESRRLQGLPADSAARVACGGDTVSTAYVLCNGPYLVYIQDPAVNPPNLAAVQELSAGFIRLNTVDPTTDGELWVDDIRVVDPISRVGSAVALDAHLVASDVGDISASYIRQDGYFQQIGAQPTYRTTGTFQLGTGIRAERFLPAGLGIVLPVQVSYARTTVAPQLLTGSDIEGANLANLRSPENWTLAYSMSVRRQQRGSSWLVQGLVDPVTLSASFTRGRSVSELSDATSSGRDLNATYGLSPGRTGFGLNLAGIVDKLPGFLRHSAAGEGLRRPFINLAPSSVRFSSGLSRSQSDLFAYQVPVHRADDSLVQAVTALTDLWRNSAGLTWQPLGMLNLSGDLSSTRDLRHYSDSTTLGRLAGASRKRLLGMDVGVERDRQLSTSLVLAPAITQWLRPRFATASSFVLSRSLTSRRPIQVDGDSAGAFILPQTLNNSRFNEYGLSFEAGRLLGGVFGDSSVLGRATRRIRPLTLTDRLTHTSTFDLASFSPDLGFQLGLGGLDSFLRHQGDSAIGATEVRNTTLASGADLPLGLSFTLGYTRTRSSQFQRTAGGYLTTETRQREWPKGSVRLTETLRGGPIALIGLGATFRSVQGTSQAPGPNGTVQTENTSSNLAPDANISLRNGMNFTFSYNLLHQ
ncbi:MAG TPA: hypothetical protein VNH46_01115, partial [Gemmatimonadales bacterium]|nr:hypothetical protein [Gemmatimonadales bacterium]